MLQIDPVPALLKRLQQTEMAEAERRANLVFQKGLSKDDSVAWSTIALLPFRDYTFLLKSLHMNQISIYHVDHSFSRFARILKIEQATSEDENTLSAQEDSRSSAEKGSEKVENFQK